MQSDAPDAKNKYGDAVRL